MFEISELWMKDFAGPSPDVDEEVLVDRGCEPVEDPEGAVVD